MHIIRIFETVRNIHMYVRCGTCLYENMSSEREKDSYMHVLFSCNANIGVSITNHRGVKCVHMPKQGFIYACESYCMLGRKMVKDKNIRWLGHPDYPFKNAYIFYRWTV